MKRAKNESARTKPEKMLPMYTPERAATLARLTRTLWAEMRRHLRAMQVELDWLGGGGEAPVHACKARVTLMLAAMQAMAKNAQILVEPLADDAEPWHWIHEFEQSMQRWLMETEKDLEDCGTTPEGEDPHDDTWFTPAFALSLGWLRVTYDDWSYAAGHRSSIKGPDDEESHLKRIDVALKRISDRIPLRRAEMRAAVRSVSAGRVPTETPRR